MPAEKEKSKGRGGGIPIPPEGTLTEPAKGAVLGCLDCHETDSQLVQGWGGEFCAKALTFQHPKSSVTCSELFLSGLRHQYSRKQNGN